MSACNDFEVCFRPMGVTSPDGLPTIGALYTTRRFLLAMRLIAVGSLFHARIVDPKDLLADQ